jgi:hypothetical protein
MYIIEEMLTVSLPNVPICGYSTDSFMGDGGDFVVETLLRSWSHSLLYVSFYL